MTFCASQRRDGVDVDGGSNVQHSLNRLWGFTGPVHPG